MVRKLIILSTLVAVGALIAKKIKAANDERTLWHEATTAPDLR
jgi:hypothetical protein